MTLLGVVVFLLALTARWAEDVAAPFINVAEAEMASAVTLEADGGPHRIVTSGPTRPSIQLTVCEIASSDGTKKRVRGADGLDGGHERFGVTRVIELTLPAGRNEVTCGRIRPTGGAGLGRFQVVDAGGLFSRGVTVALGLGVTCLLSGLLWFGLLYWRRGPGT